MEKLTRLIYHHRFIVGYSCAAAIFLALLNDWLWPTPDEYLYATLARTFIAGAQGLVSLANTNTEHVAFLSLIGAFYQTIVEPSRLADGRLFMIGFGLGIIWLLYAMAGKLNIDPKHRSWFLWLLLLIPGFWIFSVRFMLDIPSTFAIGVILYLLLTKKPALVVSTGLVLLFLFKEYFIYLIVPMCVILYAIDAVRSKQVWWKKIGLWLIRCLVICLPIYLITVLLIDFHWLPYPRLLENGLAFIFKNNFLWLNEQTVALLDRYVQLLDPTTTFSTPYTLPPLVSETKPIHEVVETAVAVTSGEPALLESNTTQTVTNSPATIIQGTFLEKLWYIYSYNFSETDLNIFILPLSLIGMIVRAQAIWRGWKKQYQFIRPDILFTLLLAVFAYLNYHEANSLIGFRLTLPIIFPLIYFAYHGANVILHKPRRWQLALWLSAMVFTLLGYWWTVKDLTYGSVLANSSAVSLIVAYKPYFFIGLFVICVIGMLFYHRLRWSWKPRLLILAMLIIFTLKFLPFAIDDRISEKLYGYDYGLAGATPVLHSLVQESTRVCSNVHYYKQQYYANDVYIGNEDINPQIRVPTKRYLYRYATCPFDDELITYIQDAKIDYLLVVNYQVDDADYNNWLQIYQQHPKLFALVESQELNGRVQWAIYQIN